MKFLKKIRKSGFWIGILLFIFLYAGGVLMRDFLTPLEYRFALHLHTLLPSFSGAYLPKLPAMTASLLSGLLLFTLSVMLKIHRPGAAAGIFLLFPPYFFLGTGASGIPVFAFSILLVFTAVVALFRCRKAWSKLLWGVAGIAGAGLFCLLLQYGFFNPLFWFFFWLPEAALGIAALLERLHDRDRAVPFVNALARIFSILSVITAVMILLPALARYFHFSYPDYLTFYERNERLYRPVVLLLIPLLWLHLCRTERKLAAKEAFFGAALAFVLLLTPIVLPHSLRKISSPTHLLRHYRTELMQGSPRCWADSSSAAALTYETGFSVSIFGYEKSSLPPAKLKAAVESEYKAGRDSIIAFSSHSFDSSLPTLPGVRYASGKYVIIRYPGGALK